MGTVVGQDKPAQAGLWDLQRDPEGTHPEGTPISDGMTPVDVGTLWWYRGKARKPACAGCE